MLWKTSAVEDLWVTLKPLTNMTSLHINCSYLPGDIDTTKFESHTDNISYLVNLNPTDAFIILGDYNVPDFASVTSKSTSSSTSLKT